MTAFGKCNGGGRRRAARAPLPLIAVFTTLSRSHEAVVVDLSSTGARLRSDDLPDSGEEVLLSIEQVRAFGTIAWSHDGECGVNFDPPLEARDLRLLRHRAGDLRGLMPELQAALDDWTMGLAR